MYWIYYVDVLLLCNHEVRIIFPVCWWVHTVVAGETIMYWIYYVDQRTFVVQCRDDTSNVNTVNIHVQKRTSIKNTLRKNKKFYFFIF